MLEIDLGISLHQPRLICLDEPDLRCVRAERSGARIAYDEPDGRKGKGWKGLALQWIYSGRTLPPYVL